MLRTVGWWKMDCGVGIGLDAHAASNLLATSDAVHDTISLWEMPQNDLWGEATLACVCEFGGAGSEPPMRFSFGDPGYPICRASGALGFVDAPEHPLMLLVTDCGQRAVHIINIPERAHAGYVASPGTIVEPRGLGVGRGGTMVAVSAWKRYEEGNDFIYLFHRRGVSNWDVVRTVEAVDGPPTRPMGLNFARDGASVCVTHMRSGSVTRFSVEDGQPLPAVAASLPQPTDVVEVEEGFVVACSKTSCVDLVHRQHSTCRRLYSGFGDFRNENWSCSCLTQVPGAGVLVRDLGGNTSKRCGQGFVKVLSNWDAIAMRFMRAARTAWMIAVVRAILAK